MTKRKKLSDVCKRVEKVISVRPQNFDYKTPPMISTDSSGGSITCAGPTSTPYQVGRVPPLPPSEVLGEGAGLWV